jgi:folate-binding protein YgfZ
MTDKPPCNIALPGHGLVVLDGPDATRFAQAQFANDVVQLAAGDWQWNTWLTAKGRVIALFALLKRRDDLLWLWLPDAPAGAIATALARFVFRSKVTVRVDTGHRLLGALAATVDAHGARIGSAGTGDVLELDLSSDAGPRRLWLAPVATLPGDASDTAHAHHDAWRAADLLAGLPRLADTQAERWTPQQLSLERLAAFSVKKGCYPGQEIVARTHFLGQAKRHLALFDAPDGAEIAIGASLLDSADAAQGEVVCTATSGTGTLVLAVVHAGEHGALTCGGIAMAPRPLSGGLAR